MLIKIGSFSKEINSTKKVSLSNLRDINVQIKEPSSLISPVIRLHNNNFTGTDNYIYIPEWSRYYFINNAVITPGMVWEVQLALDVLASWKDGILASSAYVTRSANKFNNKLIDGCWSHTTDCTVSKTEIDLGLSTGNFLLFTTSDDGQESVNSVPAVSTYFLGPAALKNVCNKLFTDDFFANVSEGLDVTSANLSKMFFNPFQYIVKCMWVPFNLSDFTYSQIENIGFGYWDSPEIGYRIVSHQLTKSFTFTLGSYSDWTDRDATWTHNTLYLPGFGQIDISTDYQGKTVTGNIVFDIATGEAGLFLYVDGGLIQSRTGKLGADVQLSSLYENVSDDLGSMSGLVSTGIKAGSGLIAGIASKAKDIGGFIGSSFAMSYGQEVDLSQYNIGDAAKTVSNSVVSALQPTMSTIGANGTRAIIEQKNKGVLTITKHTRYTDIHDRLGGMCNQILTLNECTGYTEVANPHVNIAATSGEISMINGFLSGGFYIE